MLTRYGLNGGSTLRARRSSQLMWRKNGWALETQWQTWDLIFHDYSTYLLWGWKGRQRGGDFAQKLPCWQHWFEGCKVGGEMKTLWRSQRGLAKTRHITSKIYLDLGSISWSGTKTQRGISFQQLKQKVWRFVMFPQRPHVHQSTSQKEGSPFSGGPWLLVLGKAEGWVCISRFYQLSFFGFHRWMGAKKE